ERGRDVLAGATEAVERLLVVQITAGREVGTRQLELRLRRAGCELERDARSGAYESVEDHRGLRVLECETSLCTFRERPAPSRRGRAASRMGSCRRCEVARRTTTPARTGEARDAACRNPHRA